MSAQQQAVENPPAGGLRRWLKVGMGGLLGLQLVACAGSMQQLVEEGQAGAPARADEVNYRAYLNYLKALDAERVDDNLAAEQYLRRTIDFDPGAVEPRVRLGRVLARMRRIPEAIRMTEQAIQLAPSHYAAHLQLAQLQQYNGDSSGAEATLKKCMKLEPTREEAYFDLANLYRLSNRQKDGLQVIQEFQSRNQGMELRMQILLAQLYRELDQPDKAEAQLINAVEEFADYPQAQRALFEFYLSRGHLAETAVRLEKLYQERPWLEWIPEVLVGVFARTGDVAGINRQLTQAEDHDPAYAEDLRLEAVEELAARREFDKAMLVLQPMLERTSNERALYYAGFLHARRRERDKALAMYSRIPEGSEYYPRAVEQRALTLRADEKNEDAVALLRTYLQKEPQDAELRLTLVGLLSELHRNDEALTEVEILLKNNPRDVGAIIQKAFIYSETNRVAEGEKLLRKALDDNRGNARLWESLASYLGQTGRPEGAVEVLRDGIKLLPDNLSLRFALGTWYDQLKRHDDAVSQMQKILELDPDNAEALNFIGYTWADQGMRLEEAEVMLKRAMELSPNSGYITDSLGWLYYKQGRMEEAIHLLERAVELTTREPVIVDHLGDAYRKAGNLERARAMYERALGEVKQLDTPDPQLQRSIEEKLQAIPKGGK